MFSDSAAQLSSINGFVERASKIVVIHIGFNDKISIRRWPVEYHLELIQRLSQEKDVFVIIIGLNPADKIDDFLKFPRCINLIGKTNIRELLALFNISKALVTHDSGIAHVASLSNINTFVLFGPETPVLYMPLNLNKTILYADLACSPCINAYNQRYSTCKNNMCLKKIKPDQVYTALKKYI